MRYGRSCRMQTHISAVPNLYSGSTVLCEQARKATLSLPCLPSSIAHLPILELQDSSDTITQLWSSIRKPLFTRLTSVLDSIGNHHLNRFRIVANTKLRLRDKPTLNWEVLKLIIFLQCGNGLLIFRRIGG